MAGDQEARRFWLDGLTSPSPAGGIPRGNRHRYPGWCPHPAVMEGAALPASPTTRVRPGCAAGAVKGGRDRRLPDAIRRPVGGIVPRRIAFFLELMAAIIYTGPGAAAGAAPRSLAHAS
jgi:hypothetical protein